MKFDYNPNPVASPPPQKVKRIQQFNPEEDNLPTSVGGCDEVIAELESRMEADPSLKKQLLPTYLLVATQANKLAGFYRYKL